MTCWACLPARRSERSLRRCYESTFVLPSPHLYDETDASLMQGMQCFDQERKPHILCEKGAHARSIELVEHPAPVPSGQDDDWQRGRLVVERSQFLVVGRNRVTQIDKRQLWPHGWNKLACFAHGRACLHHFNATHTTKWGKQTGQYALLRGDDQKT